MDELEKYIRDNRSAFEEKGPEKDVWSRLEKSLWKEDRNLKRAIVQFAKPVRKWVAVAAMFILAVSFAAFVRTYQVKQEMREQVIPSDLLDAQAFYKTQIHAHITRINRLRPEGLSGDSAVWKMFGENDAEYDRLRDALSANPNNPHVRAAFVEYYRSRLEILKRIQNRLENKNTPLKK